MVQKLGSISWIKIYNDVVQTSEKLTDEYVFFINSNDWIYHLRILATDYDAAWSLTR